MFDKLLKHIITSQLIIYIIRCVLGFLIGYGLMLKFSNHELFWLLLSVILVISPEGKDSRKLTSDRVKSNLIGSIVGLVCHFIHATNLSMLIIGIVLTCIVCYFFKIMNMCRVAIVAFLIIMLQSNHINDELAPVFRFATVTIGCFIGLGITIFISILIKKLKKRYSIPIKVKK